MKRKKPQSKIEFINYPEIGKTYQHYKGGKYKVLSLAKHSETDESFVVYKSIGYKSIHIRPLSMWFDIIRKGTSKITAIYRFKLIDKKK